MTRGRTLLSLALACCAAGAWPAAAQQAPGGGWQVQQGGQQGGFQQGTPGGGQQLPLQLPGQTQTQQDLPPNTTVVPRTRGGDAKAGGVGQVTLSAMLTEDGQGIEQGVIWRVYRDIAGPDGKARLVSTLREASPTLRLDAGDYFVNIALGRANLTRKITVIG